jgi:hypothetical protein
MDNYIIINKEIIQKRIEELNEYCKTHLHQALESNERKILKEILSNTIPLQPEIEKVCKSAIYKFESNAFEVPELVKEAIDEAISQLKLDI